MYLIILKTFLALDTIRLLYNYSDLFIVMHEHKISTEKQIDILKILSTQR